MQWKYLLNSIIYMAVLGILCFPMGRLFAKIRFDAGKFPFCPTGFEKNSGIYEKLRVREWQNRVPDVSRMLPGIVPKKQINNSELNILKVELMINETCVAELTHVILGVFGVALLFIWPGVGGVTLFLLYLFAGNLPFIIIQRYNRPRLVHLRHILEKKEKRRLSSCKE